MDYEPLSVALRFGFIALLYIFLLWIARSSRADMNRLMDGGGGAPTGTGVHDLDPHVGAGEADPEGWLVVAAGGGLQPGTRFDAFGGVSIGRSSEADIRIKDRYASSIHARVFPVAGGFILEDMRSTNGTTLNGRRIEGEVVLEHGDRIGIGDTELVFEAA